MPVFDTRQMYLPNRHTWLDGPLQLRAIPIADDIYR